MEAQTDEQTVKFHNMQYSDSRSLLARFSEFIDQSSLGVHEAPNIV